MVLAALLGLNVGLLRHFDKIQKKGNSESYGKKLSELATKIKKTASELDLLLVEVEIITQNRQDKMKSLEENLAQMNSIEVEQRKKIETLAQVKPEAIEYLLEHLEPAEKRSVRRDYMLFIAGLLFSALIAIILKLLGIG